MATARVRTRRQFLRGLVAVGGASALAACLDAGTGREVPQGDPDVRPNRQHAWEGALATDEDGNNRLPEHHVLLALELVTQPGEESRETVETALLSLEQAYAYDSEGLLFTVGYSPAYFERLDSDPPVPEPTEIIDGEAPDVDEFDALVHLASDDPAVVIEAEEALLGEMGAPNGVSMEATFEGVFERAGPRRTGFIGPGLPADYTDLDGVPDTIPKEAPFFMGFRSGFAESQAPLDRATIQEGPFAGGTTAHLESMTLQLQTWFEQESHFQRVAQLFSPEHAEEEWVGEFGERLGTASLAAQVADDAAEHARTRGLVGHAQKAARGRDADGTPPLLRRDFNTIDGDRPGVHFLSHQRSIGDFVRVREAMEGRDLAGEGVGQAHNNGILQYIFVQRRGNFLVPPRDQRALPDSD